MTSGCDPHRRNYLQFGSKPTSYLRVAGGDLVLKACPVQQPSATIYVVARYSLSFAAWIQTLHHAAWPRLAVRFRRRSGLSTPVACQAPEESFAAPLCEVRGQINRRANCRLDSLRLLCSHDDQRSFVEREDADEVKPIAPSVLDSRLKAAKCGPGDLPILEADPAGRAHLKRPAYVVPTLRRWCLSACPKGAKWHVEVRQLFDSPRVVPVRGYTVRQPQGRQRTSITTSALAIPPRRNVLV